MLQVEDIIKKLKQFIGYENDNELAAILGIKPNTLASWKVRKTLSYSKIIDLCRKCNIDLNDLFSVYPDSGLNIDLGYRRVRMISADHQVEYFLNKQKCCLTAPISTFPTDQEIDMAFQIAVDNMYPTLNISSYVLSKKIELNEIKVWQLYLLIIENKGVLCYRFKRYTLEGELVFISDNPTFDNVTINPKDVREIFSIRGVFIPNIKHLI